MLSPVDPKMVLVSKEIEPGLWVFACPVSGGVWIPLQSYMDWRSGHSQNVGALPTGYVPSPPDDSGRKALLCPESGCMLIRYRVGHGLHFQIDRSPLTGGVWLDKGEWDALKSKKLHGELHLIFTAQYQAKIRSDEIDKNLEEVFRARIGPEDFEKAREFREWLVSHPRHRDILCYLLDGRTNPAEQVAPPAPQGR
jgi:Zn-finger nucleic acid-binding protein